MDVNAESTKAGFMQRDMTENHSVHNVVCTKFTEVLSILVIPEDVMVATDKNLVPIETTHDAKCSAIDYYIAKMVNFVAWSNSIVPPTNHFFIHFLGSIPGAKFRLAVSAHKVTDTVVSKMGITNQKCSWHHRLL
jgi:hypothetical protein